jgi:hypothetical protein
MLRVLTRVALGLLVFLAMRLPAHAQDGRAPGDASLETEEGELVISEDVGDPGWALERFATRFGVFQQDGAGGFQSQASADRHGRGSEETWIFQPILYGRIRQDQNIHHDVYIPVDVITAASTDALDVVSSASRDSEAVSLDIYSTVEADPDSRYTLHWGGHIEEPLRSVFIGLSASRDLAEDNAVLTTSFDLIVDVLDPVQFTGYDPGLDERLSGTINTTLSQLLSPTTVVSVSYGLTAQLGTLMTTWNSVPVAEGDRTGDLFPQTRIRHAFSGRLTQAIPDTRTFFSLQYRFYVDDFGVLAHTPEGSLTQYLGEEVSLRLSYRFHTQTAASFWTSVVPLSFDFANAPRTADSDMEALDAHELGLTARWYYDPGGARTSASSYFEASYYHYERTNGLFVNLASLGWGLLL